MNETEIEKNYHFFKLENDELNNNKIYIWTYWKLNIDNVDVNNNNNINNLTDVFEIIISDGERLWNQNIRIKDISQYIKNIKEKDYYTLIKKALSYTKKDIQEKFIYNWDLKDDISNFTIKLEISNSTDKNLDKFQYLLGNINLLSVKSENRKKIYQLIFNDTVIEYQKLKNENEFLLNANNSLQKIQNDFSKQMEGIIEDKKKLEEVYLLKFRELLNEKKRKIKNLMIALKRKEEIINEYKKMTENSTINKNTEPINNNKINNEYMNIEPSDKVNSKKRKREYDASDNDESQSSSHIRNKMNNDKKTKDQAERKDKNNININNDKKTLNDSKNDNTKPIIKSEVSVTTNNINSDNDNDSDSDSDLSAFNLIPNVEVRTYTGSNKLPTLNSSIDLLNINTPKDTRIQKDTKKQNDIKDKTEENDDDSTTDDDIDKLLGLI